MKNEQETQSNVHEQPNPQIEQLLNRLLRQPQRVWRVLEYSSAYMGLIAAAEVISVMLVLSLPQSTAPLVAGLVTFTIYANDRLTDVDSDELVNTARSEFVRQHRQELYILAAMSYGLALTLAALGGPLAFGLSVIPGCLWVLYAVDWVPNPTLGFGRLKEILFLNSALVAAAWAATIVFLPIAVTEAPIDSASVVLFLYFFFGTFIGAEVSNVRDVVGDRAIGVATVPVVFGIHRTRYILQALNLLNLAILLVALSSSIFSLSALVALATGLVGPAVVIWLLGRVQNERGLSLALEYSRIPVLITLPILSF